MGADRLQAKQEFHRVMDGREVSDPGGRDDVLYRAEPVAVPDSCVTSSSARSYRLEWRAAPGERRLLIVDS